MHLLNQLHPKVIMVLTVRAVCCIAQGSEKLTGIGLARVYLVASPFQGLLLAFPVPLQSLIVVSSTSDRFMLAAGVVGANCLLNRRAQLW